MFINLIKYLHRANEDSLALATENRNLRHQTYELQTKLAQKQKRINDLELIVKQLLVENNKNK